MEEPNITQRLIDLTDGRREALDQLMPLVYDELRSLARRHLRSERAGHTLNTTALVHEAYLKLVKLDRMQWQNRAHFFSIASRAVRNILVDHAVQRKAAKRGGGQAMLSLEGSEVEAVTDNRTISILVLDDALKRLEKLNERQAQIVQQRFFGGLKIEETATVLGVSPATVKRDWTLARAWLNRELQQGSA